MSVRHSLGHVLKQPTRDCRYRQIHVLYVVILQFELLQDCRDLHELDLVETFFASGADQRITKQVLSLVAVGTEFSCGFEKGMLSVVVA